MEENEAVNKLIDEIMEDPSFWSGIERLSSKWGTYADAEDLAEIMGDRMAAHVAANLEAFGLNIVDLDARAVHDLLMDICEQAQTNLNAAAGIGLKPLRRKYPQAKVNALIEDLADVSEDALADAIVEWIPSLALEMVDAVQEYNLDFQAKSGLKPVIVRTWSGSYPSHDTKHTDWCRDLAGEYNYGSEPNRVYARHKGCRCKVEYFPSKEAKGRITALSKGEIDRAGVLWNTRQDTLEARIRKKNRKN